MNRGERADKAPQPARAIFAWCLYDWANSAFPTLITTFVFATYFTRAIASSPEAGTAAWAWANGIAAFVIAVLSPILGAIADRGAGRKPWLAAFTALAAFAAAMLWFAAPGGGWVIWSLVWVAIGTAAFELGTVFYNAMLPGLAPPGRMGRISGWGWGLGYAGGLACLLIALFGLIQPEPPPFGLDRAAAEPVRATALLVALWYGLFALPLFWLVADRNDGARAGAALAVREGLADLWTTLRDLRHEPTFLRFLIGQMLCMNGVVTLFAFGGIYAAGSFGMDESEVLVFGIALNVTGALGAAGFAWLDDWIGARRTILIALGGIIVLSAAVLAIETKTWFWLLGLLLGSLFGPVQAASRSFMARLAPPEKRTQLFGMLALSGKATAFLGPVVLGAATAAFASQRAGMATILLFLIPGFILVWRIDDPRA